MKIKAKLRKLVLTKETLRALATMELEAVRAGLAYDTSAAGGACYCPRLRTDSVCPAC